MNWWISIFFLKKFWIFFILNSTLSLYLQQWMQNNVRIKLQLESISLLREESWVFNLSCFSAQSTSPEERSGVSDTNIFSSTSIYTKLNEGTYGSPVVKVDERASRKFNETFFFITTRKKLINTSFYTAFWREKQWTKDHCSLFFLV